MGKASKWFRKVIGEKKKSGESLKSGCCSFSTSRRRWTFVKSYRETDLHFLHYPSSNQQLTKPSPFTHNHPQQSAAVLIQAAFRGCLARRALRALKGLVRLQALVRGNIERKRTAEWFQRMQTLMRAQERARIARSQVTELSRSNTKPSSFYPIGPSTPENFEHNTIRSMSNVVDQTLRFKRNGSITKSKLTGNGERAKFRMNQSEIWRNEQPHLDDERTRNGKIFDINIEKARFLQQQKNCLHLEEGCFCVVDDSPHNFSTSSKLGGNTKRSPFTGYSDYYPNYMASTESSKAKVRSLSAPRLRPGCEMLTSVQSVSALHESFVAKAYPGSGRFDNLGMPVTYKLYADCI